MFKNTPISKPVSGEDWDNISLTSTQDSVHSDNHEYIVEQVLAEKRVYGKNYYLLQWQGYPEKDWTWEPSSNILDKNILKTWRERRAREREGSETPFDYVKFDAFIQRLKEEHKDRKRRREAKRQRLGKTGLKSNSDAQGTSSNEASEASHIVQNNNGAERNSAPVDKAASPRKEVARSPTDTLPKEVTSRTPDIIQQKSFSIAESSLPKEREHSSRNPFQLKYPSAQRQRKSTVEESDSGGSSPLDQMPLTDSMPGKVFAESTRLNSPGLTTTAPKEVAPKKTSTLPESKSGTRGGSMVSKNVFTNKTSKKKRPNIHENSTDLSKQPRHYSNMHIQYKAQKAGKALEDAAPDINALPSGLFDPSDPSAYRPPVISRKSSSSVVRRPPEVETLFVPENDLCSERPKSSNAAVAPDVPSPGLPPEPTHEFWESTLEQEQATCWFWRYRGGRCAHRSACRYLHRIVSGIPIAPQPPGVELQRATCFWWNLNGTCIKGDFCSYLHEHQADIPIAPDPRRRDSHQDQGFSNHGQSNMNHPWSLSPASTENVGVEPSRQENLVSVGNPTKLQVRCYFWSTKGSCKWSDSCKYLHLSDPAIPVADKPEPPRLRNSTDTSTNEPVPDIPDDNEHILDLPLAHGATQVSSLGCESEKETAIDVLKDAPDDSKVAEVEVDSTIDKPFKAQSRPPWDPSDPCKSICHDWFTSTCKVANCKFIHDDDISLPLTPAPGKRTCIYWAQNPNGNKCRFGPRCRDLHTFTDHYLDASNVSEEQQPKDAPSTAEALLRRASQSSKGSETSHEAQSVSEKPQNSLPAPEETTDLKEPSGTLPTGEIAIATSASHKTHHQGPDSVTGNEIRVEKYGSGNSNRGTNLRTNQQDQFKDSPAKRKDSGSLRKSIKFVDDKLIPITDEPESLTRDFDAQEIKLQKVSKHKSAADIRPRCKFWARGLCHFGAACRNHHDDASGKAEASLCDSRDLCVTIPSGLRSKLPTCSEDLPAVVISNQPSTDILMTNTNASLQSRGIQSVPTLPESSTLLSVQANGSGRTRTSLDEPSQQRAEKSLNIQAKTIFFPIDKFHHGIAFDLGKLTEEEALEPWGRTLLELPTISFDKFCAIANFKLYLGEFRRASLKQGPLNLAAPETSTSSSFIEEVVQSLIQKHSAFVTVVPHFIILAYPSRAEEYAFLGHSSTYPANAKLCYAIFESNLNPESVIEPPTKDQQNVVSRSYRKNLMRDIQELDVSRLLPFLNDHEKKAQRFKYNFYFLFPPAANATAEFLLHWLRAHNPTSKVFSCQTQGSWEYFIREVRYGVILIHESLAAEICRLPLLSFLLNRRRAITIWYIVDSNPQYPMFPSVYELEDSTFGKISATRLFPSGAALLLTPTFLISEPENAYELLQWVFGTENFSLRGKDALKGRGPLKGKSDLATANTWKIVCCYGFLDYLLDVADAKSLERDHFITANYEKPSVDAEANERGIGFETCSLRYQLYQFMLEQVEQSKRRADISLDEFDYYGGIADENESPIIYADRNIDPDDEKALMNWYAGWSATRLDHFRKFVIIGTDNSSAPRAARLKKVALKKVTTQAASPGGQSPTKSTSGEIPMDLDDPEDSPFKQLRIAQSSMVTDDMNLGLQIPKPVEKSSMSKERSSVNPQDLRKLATSNLNMNKVHAPSITRVTTHDQTSLGEGHRNRGALNDLRQHEVDPPTGLSDRMDIDTDGVEDGEGDKIEWKEVKFMPTMDWYKEVAGEIGWNHLFVGAWEKQWELLEFKR